MKKYFAKFLPIKGKPLEGGWAFCTHEEPNLGSYSLIHLIGKEWEFYKAQNGWYPAEKAKLFLCSKDIKPGDKVYELYKDGRISKEFEWTWAMDSCLHSEGVFKVIGEISQEASWIKEMDEIDENKIRIIYTCEKGSECDMHFGKQVCTAPHEIIDTIKIKGPCGHFH